MPKLRAIKPRLAVLPSRLKRDMDADGHSQQAEPWRTWYSLKAWKLLRLDVFTRDFFACQWAGCGFMDATGSELVADHKKPHRGDPKLFWDRTNVHTLCTACHNSRKQAEERAARMGGWVEV